MTKYTNDLVEKALEERKEVYDRMAEQLSKGVLIYGAAFMGEYVFDYLVNKGVKINFFVDKNPQKIGTYFKGVEVISPDDERITEDACMIITVRYFVKDIESKYKEKNLTVLPFLAFHVLENYDKYANVRDCYMEDEMSKETYNALLYSLLTGNASACEDVMVPKQYFVLKEFSGAVLNDVFVDIGACVGDTIEEFVWEHKAAFKEIYAFEPGQKQYNAMKIRVKRLCEEWCIDEEKIHLINAGVSDKQGKMSMVTGATPLVGDFLTDKSGDNMIDVYTLDEYFCEKKVTFIKADVEGMEMQVLEGAREIISKYKPKLAMCVYHYPEDLYTIANYIKSLNPDYKFKLRLHMPELSEYVLYCY